jgi:lipid-binding SYLF domain-containing protein
MIHARKMFLALAVMAALVFNGVHAAQAATAKEIDTNTRQALAKLYRNNATAESIGKQAKAVLIFPNIVKGGFIIGGSYGEGAMLSGDKTLGYYSSASASWGLQAGAQSYGYALFLMNDKAIQYVNKSKGWEVGVDPTVVVVDAGAAKNLSTSTLKDDAYSFTFGQQGLMAGISIAGAKVTKIKR